MRNSEIADAFAELADRLALTDQKPYRYMAYRKADATFRELGESVAVLSREGRLREIEGVGAAIEEKVAQLVQTGTFDALERARDDVDDTLLALTRLPGIGPATARKVFAALDGEGFDSLLERAASGSLAVGGGVTKKVVDALAAEAARRLAGDATPSAAMSGVPRDDAGAPLPGPWFRRDQADVQLATLDSLLAEHGPLARGGEYARGCELVRGVDVLVECADAAATRSSIAAVLVERGFHDEGCDDDRCAFVSPSGMPVHVVVATSPVPAATRAMLAGPPAWADLLDVPGAADVPIELRDAVLAGTFAIDTVPTDLVTVADLRGELHAHSDWSDGRATILEMALAARARGDEYFCVTDHTAPYAMVGGLDPDRLRAQADEIARVNEQLQREHEEDGAPPMRVLRGSEVEVLADGSLGLPDQALARLDWVVASIHVAQRQSAGQILDRMRRVIDNPLVDAIGHPTSRRLLLRERTALDVDALIELALQAGVVLEVNANPDRLDLDSTHARRALEAGVRLTINTDAHRTGTLALREHGVAVARRAGARRDQVVNCLDVDALLAGRRRG